MKRQTPLRVVFDVPVVLVELLYWREALDLDVAPDMPPAASVVERAPAPNGAAGRWRQAYADLIDQFEHDALKPGRVALDGGGDRPGYELPPLARAWINEQRLRVIDGALTSSKQNGPRGYRRGRSLAGGPVTRVLVLPVVGHYSAADASSPRHLARHLPRRQRLGSSDHRMKALRAHAHEYGRGLSTFRVPGPLEWHAGADDAARG